MSLLSLHAAASAFMINIQDLKYHNTVLPYRWLWWGQVHSLQLVSASMEGQSEWEKHQASWALRHSTRTNPGDLWSCTDVWPHSTQIVGPANNIIHTHNHVSTLCMLDSHLEKCYSLTTGVPIFLNKAPTRRGTHSTQIETGAMLLNNSSILRVAR